MLVGKRRALSEVALRVDNKVTLLSVSNAHKSLEKMNTVPLLIDCLINGSFYIQAMIDTGCLCFSVINETLVRNYSLYSEKITPLHLRLADGTKAQTITRIARIARIKIDIDGSQE